VADASPDTAPPAPADDRERFAVAWETFATAVRRARSRAADRTHSQLSHAQVHLMVALEGCASLSVGELARAAGVSSPTATRILDALEEDGLVRRETVEGDRRRTAVWPTDAGRAAIAEWRSTIERDRDTIYAELTPAEREQAERLLPRLAEVIERL